MFLRGKRIQKYKNNNSLSSLKLKSQISLNINVSSLIVQEDRRLSKKKHALLL